MAYAAVISLGRTLDQILNPNRDVILHDKKVFTSVREKVTSLQKFLEKSAQGSDAFENLSAKIRDAAYKAEDIIETQVYHFKSLGPFRIPHLAINSYANVFAFLQIMMPFCRVYELAMRFRDMMFHWPYEGLEKLSKQFDSFLEEVEKISEIDGQNLKAMDSLSRGSSMVNFSENNITVGLDDDLLKIKDRLTGLSSRLGVIPIVGMGGIGKTTLAQNIYTDPLILHHFDARAWITISQTYNVRDILLKLLDSLGKLTDKMLRQGDDGLAEHIYKTLSGRRYLIVMDDLWSTNAWDEFKRYFPDNCNGSRIILTTRLERVAIYAASCSPLHSMNLLSGFKSWELLRTKVFGEEKCPVEFLEVGYQIALGCKGLPLAIIVISGFLSKVERTFDEWEKVADNLRSIVNKDGGDTCLEILFLSYNNLPQHLKPCFLYMGVFPEDSQISISKVVKLWAAEGFLKQNRIKTLEEVAKACILELAERSLISVFGKRREKDYGRIKTIRIHDLLRDLCIREARKEKFLHIMERYDDHCPLCMKHLRRISVDENIPIDDPFFKCFNHRITSFESVSLVRSLVYLGRHPIPSFVFSGFKILRVLDITRVQFFEFPLEVVELYNLRYLAFSYHGEVPESISKLCNLETLIFSPLLKNFAQCPRPLPLAIWSMPKLRHLRFHVWYLTDFPRLLPGWKTRAFLENLQTLSEVSVSFCEKEILQEIPNLAKLNVWFENWDLARFYVNNLVCLRKLEFLKCTVRSFPIQEALKLPIYDSTPRLSFPVGLKELTLIGCRIPWQDMTVVGCLPNLERLKLRDHAFVGREWLPVEGQFRNLSFLYIDGSDLVHWRAESVHFPLLRHLIVQNCRKLETISYGIGEISTLEILELDKSSPSAVTSVEDILEEQRNSGNDSLRIHIYPVGSTSSC